MKWVTRERPKIDRLACPWLIRRFIDADAEIHYVPADHVLAFAATEGAIPFDVPGVELTHSGPLCSFDAFLEKYRVEDPRGGHRHARAICAGSGFVGHLPGSRREHRR